MYSDEFVVVGQCHSGLGEGDKDIESLREIPKLLSAWQRKRSVSGER